MPMGCRAHWGTAGGLEIYSRRGRPYAGDCSVYLVAVLEQGAMGSGPSGLLVTQIPRSWHVARSTRGDDDGEGGDHLASSSNDRSMPVSASPAIVRPMAYSVFAAAPHEMFRRVAAAPHEMMRAPSPAPDPELRLSDLEWIGDLGEGGFAMVTKVRHRRTGAVFVLKVALHPDVDAKEEAEVIRRTSGSPHIVHCYTLLRGRGGEPMRVLELMDADSLCDVLYRRGSRGLPESALAEMATHYVMGLAQLYSRGVAHLDVKPDNLLANARGEVKINYFNTSQILYGSGEICSSGEEALWRRGSSEQERGVDLGESCGGVDLGESCGGVDRGVLDCVLTGH